MTTGKQQSIHYYHTDILGSLIAESNAQGQLEWQEVYAPYGRRLVQPGTDNRQWYTGKTEDKETRFVYLNARYYDPEIARFISPDPVHFTEENPLSFNRYAYTGNNPLTRIDPTGKDWVYSQSNGRLTHVDSRGNSLYIGTGYSGYGPGYNNSAMQNVRAQRHGDPAGPMPQGVWTILPQRNNRTGSGIDLPASMRLTPQDGTNTFGRAGFLIHGDNRRRDRSASEGCIILNRNFRDQIANSNDDILQVIP